MKRTVLVLLYTLGITVIYPCQAEPTPYGYDYLGDDKLKLEPKRKPNANGSLSRLGRNWFEQNSGLTLTNEQQQNEVSLPSSLGSELYESSEGLNLPNPLSEHNLYAPTKELSMSKSLNGPDWYEPNKVVISKGQSQYANNNELFLSNSLDGFDLYVLDSWNHILNEQKKESSLPSLNGQNSYETDIELILSDGNKQYEPDKEIFLSNSLSGEDWTGLNGGISWSNEPNKQTQYENKEELSLPKAVGHIWYKPNVDVYLPKRREENRQWDKPTKGIILQILTKTFNNDVNEILNTKNLSKSEEYTIIVMRHQEGIQLNNKVKDDIAIMITIPKYRFRSKQRTNEDSYDNLSVHGGQNFQEKGGQNSQEHSVQNHQKSSKCKSRRKKKAKNQTRFKIEHNRKECPEKGKKKPKKPHKGKKYDKNQKRFKIVDARAKGPYQKGSKQNHKPQKVNLKKNHENFQNNHDNFQDNHNSQNNGHKHDLNPEPLASKPKEFWEVYGDRPIPEILIGRPDNYGSKNDKIPSHYFK